VHRLSCIKKKVRRWASNRTTPEGVADLTHVPNDLHQVISIQRVVPDGNSTGGWQQLFLQWQEATRTLGREPAVRAFWREVELQGDLDSPEPDSPGVYDPPLDG